MLLAGFGHLAVLTADTDRLHAFYRALFEAHVERDDPLDAGGRLSFGRVGDAADSNVFALPGNREATRRAPMFGRGRLDHFGLPAASLDAFPVIRQRLVDHGASDGFVTDFGPLR